MSDSALFLSESETRFCGVLIQELQKRFGPCQLTLFGSRARRDHHEGSDIDIAMVLQPEPIGKRPTDPFDAIEAAEEAARARSGEFFVTNVQFFSSAEAFENAVFEEPFMKGVMKDGVNLKQWTAVSLRLMDSEKQKAIKEMWQRPAAREKQPANAAR